MNDVIEGLYKNNRKELLILAKEYKIEKYSRMKVAELREAIENKIRVYTQYNDVDDYDVDEDGEKEYSRGSVVSDITSDEEEEDEDDEDPKVKAISSIRLGNKFNDISYFD